MVCSARAFRQGRVVLTTVTVLTWATVMQPLPSETQRICHHARHRSLPRAPLPSCARGFDRAAHRRRSARVAASRARCGHSDLQITPQHEHLSSAQTCSNGRHAHHKHSKSQLQVLPTRHTGHPGCVVAPVPRVSAPTLRALHRTVTARNPCGSAPPRPRPSPRQGRARSGPPLAALPRRGSRTA